MKILVIGASGFVGGALARHLADVGHHVTGVIRKPAPLPAGVTPMSGDLDVRLSDVVAAAQGNDAVVLAAQVPVDVEHVAVGALLDGLAGTGKTLVFVSGSGVLMQRTWGAASEDTFGEDDPFVPEPLAERRVETEELVRAAAADRGVRGIVLRLAMLWGPGDHGHLAQIYRSVALTGAACYIGDGANCYSDLHIDDAARLCAAALDGAPAGALYHGVGGEIPVRTLAEAVARDLGCSTRSLSRADAERVWGEFGALLLGSSSRTRAVRASAELGWSPTHPDMLVEVGEPRLRALAVGGDDDRVAAARDDLR